jgi:hypothetical protein
MTGSGGSGDVSMLQLAGEKSSERLEDFPEATLSVIGSTTKLVVSKGTVGDVQEVERREGRRKYEEAAEEEDTFVCFLFLFVCVCVFLSLSVEPRAFTRRCRRR